MDDVNYLVDYDFCATNDVVSEPRYRTESGLVLTDNELATTDTCQIAIIDESPADAATGAVHCHRAPASGE